ncbi:MAG: hypothetical protein J5I98_02280 [Phaeodactylibacter sp.]|nr:hypothetical protein [Phaeodactylibacter sp.]
MNGQFIILKMVVHPKIIKEMVTGDGQGKIRTDNWLQIMKWDFSVGVLDVPLLSLP